MKTRMDEEKRGKCRPKIPESPLLSPRDSKSPNAVFQEVKHDDVVWAFYLCLDSSFAKTFMCAECNQIPKQRHAFTSKSGYIFCEYCIDKLIETQTLCKMDNKPITQKHAAKVIDNLIKSLRIKCPHCKESQLQVSNIAFQSKSQELKMEEADDEDDIRIAIPPFPTNIAQNNSNMMNEGIEQHIVGIADGACIHEKKESIYCNWAGTISQLHIHLQNDCQFIKINCPLNELDPSLCDMDSLYQHQMRKHLNECSVTHLQQIVKEINELKSIQLSVILKQEQLINSGEASTAATPNPNPNPMNSDVDITKLQTEHETFVENIENKIEELIKENKMKDVIIQCQNNKLNMMQKEIVCFKKIMDEYHKRDHNEHNVRRNNHEYESDITSMFNHTNYSLGAQKMLEMQQMMLQTQNKIDGITSQMRNKDTLIEKQNKSISSLQSQIANMNANTAISMQTQPGNPHHITPGWTPGHPSSTYDYMSSSDTVLIPPYSQRTTVHQSPPMRSSKSHDIRRRPYSPQHYNQYETHLFHQNEAASKSLNYIPMLHESEKIYRSDSGGSAENEYHRYNVSSTRKQSHTYGGIQLQSPLPLPEPVDNTQARRSIHEEDKNQVFHKNKRKKMYGMQRDKHRKHTLRKARLTIYGVGYNEEGEIGLGHRSNLSQFTRLSFCDTMHITNIYYGSQSFFYLTASNELYCCGYNKYGQLGLGHTSEYIIKPTLNKYFKSDDRIIDFISNSVCSYHTILKTQSGRLYSYGWNNNGQLGIGRKSFKESVPIELGSEIFSSNYIICISCGFHHTLFLTDIGDIICCGNNQYGQLGFGSNVNEVISPSFVDNSNGLKNIIGIQCGEYYSCCLDKNGNVLVFGRNDSAQLGLGDLIKNEECVYVPKIIEYFTQKGIVITKIRCGDYHTLCLDSKGCVFAFGNNEYGQIGCMDNNGPFVNIPSVCKLPNNKKSKVMIDIDAGAYHSILLAEDNEIYSFGNNDCQQCSTILNHKKINKPYWLKKKTEIKCLNDNNNNISQVIAGYDCSFLVISSP